MSNYKQQFENLYLALNKNLNNDKSKFYINELINLSRFLIIENTKLIKNNEKISSELKDEIFSLKEELIKLKHRNTSLTNKLNKKLSFKERVTGRIV